MWKKLIERLKEPSTYAGLAGIAASLGLTLDPGMIQTISSLFVAIFGAVAFFTKEKGNSS